LRYWLLAQAATAGVTPDSEFTVEDRGVRVEDDELVTQLREFADAEEVRTPDQQAVAMVAAVANHHQREDEPLWWAQFDRLSADPEKWPRRTLAFLVVRAESPRSGWRPPGGTRSDVGQHGASVACRREVESASGVRSTGSANRTS
jgi:hypothetical protein